MRRLNETWGKIDCPGRRTVRRSDEFRINTRDKKVCPGTDVDEKVADEKQDLENKIVSTEFRWMRRTHRTDPEEGTSSIADSSMDDNSRNSGINTYSDRNSSSGSDMSELAIHTLLVETRARDLDREVYQDPGSDRYLIPGESVFDNATDDLETIALSKLSISLLPQKKR